MTMLSSELQALTSFLLVGYSAAKQAARDEQEYNDIARKERAKLNQVNKRIQWLLAHS